MTPEEATEAAQAYLDDPDNEFDSSATVTGLLEDEADYAVVWDQDVSELGQSIVLIRKATGEIRELASAFGGEVFGRMTPVSSSG